MGSLTSRPKSSASTQVVYAPATQSTTTSASTTDTAATSTADSTPDANELRKENLLSRDRSRYGTVQTSFRGLLGLADNITKRKTLLGE